MTQESETNMDYTEQKLNFRPSKEVRFIRVEMKDLGRAMSYLHQQLSVGLLKWPELLSSQKIDSGWEFYVSGPADQLRAIRKTLKGMPLISVSDRDLFSFVASADGPRALHRAQNMLTEAGRTKGLDLTVVPTGAELTAILPHEQQHRFVETVRELWS